MRRRSLLKDSGVDWSQEYLTLIAIEDNAVLTVNIKGSDGYPYISFNGGDTWTTSYGGTQGIGYKKIKPLNKGDRVMFKLVRSQFNSDTYYNFDSSTNKYIACGNPLSIIYGDNFKNFVYENLEYAFYKLFSSAAIVSAKNLYIPPLADINMYNKMFENATNLIDAPELPATTLSGSCYYGMFNGCTSLTTAPELPATTLAASCYREMFMGCTSLTTAPELPATTLVDSCYRSMFNGCSNLNYIKAMFTTKPSTSYTRSWVSGVASSGTFVKNSAATWNVTGVNGVPSGWTIQTASA